MIAEQLGEMIRAQPFRPFVIHTADGRSVDVNHPDWIAYAGGRTALVARPDETFEIIDLLFVPSLEVKPATPSQ
jgi:hypothetical protein